MSVERLFEDSADLLLAAGAMSVGASRALLRAVESRRDMIRKVNETNPKISDDIKEDFRFKAGAVWALNWLLDLPGECQKQLKRLPEGE